MRGSSHSGVMACIQSILAQFCCTVVYLPTPLSNRLNTFCGKCSKIWVPKHNINSPHLDILKFHVLMECTALQDWTCFYPCCPWNSGQWGHLVPIVSYILYFCQRTVCTLMYAFQRWYKKPHLYYSHTGWFLFFCWLLCFVLSNWKGDEVMILMRSKKQKFSWNKFHFNNKSHLISHSCFPAFSHVGKLWFWQSHSFPDVQSTSLVQTEVCL